jgi:hypothetical protein
MLIFVSVINLKHKIMNSKIVDCIRNKQHLTSCDDDGFCNHCGYQESYHFYEIHVTGRDSYSTWLCLEQEMDDDDIIMEAINQDKISSEDIHHIDYIQSITFDEWDEWFNFNDI